MSQETMEWLRSQILSGMEKVFGKPWWDDGTGDRSNHFEDAIPRDRVETLFGYDVGRARVWIENPFTGEVFQANDYVAMVPNTHNAVYGIHSDGYEGHQFRQWLVEGPFSLVGDMTPITSAGKLRDGAQGWVQLSIPHEWKTPQGINFRSNLLSYTAFDGKLASTYKLTDNWSICDNTVAAALASSGAVYRVKHTKNSQFNVDDAKAAFHLIEAHAKETIEQIRLLDEWKVTDKQFDAFLAALVPMPDIVGKDINKRDYSTRTATMAANKREKLNELYRSDGRVEPWKGSALGVLQMVNTFNTHLATQRNVDHRALRNMENVISGKSAQADLDTLLLLAKICDRELVAV